jgi:hypothetical protein
MQNHQDQSYAAKIGKIGNSPFFLSRSGLSLSFALVFLRPPVFFFWPSARERESAEKAQAPMSDCTHEKIIKYLK